MPPSEAKWRKFEFLETKYPADLEEYLPAAPEELASINVLAGDLHHEADWDLAHVTGSPDLGSRAIIRGDKGHLREVCSVIRKSLPSLVSHLLTLNISEMEAMSRASPLGVCVGALESALSPNNTWIGELKWQLLRKNSEFDAAAARLSSTESPFCFADDAVKIMREKVQSQGPYFPM